MGQHWVKRNQKCLFSFITQWKEAADPFIFPKWWVFWFIECDIHCLHSLWIVYEFLKLWCNKFAYLTLQTKWRVAVEAQGRDRAHEEKLESPLLSAIHPLVDSVNIQWAVRIEPVPTQHFPFLTSISSVWKALMNKVGLDAHPTVFP